MSGIAPEVPFVFKYRLNQEGDENICPLNAVTRPNVYRISQYNRYRTNIYFEVRKLDGNGKKWCSFGLFSGVPNF